MTTILLSIIGALLATLILEKAPSISKWLIVRSTDHLPIENRDDRRNQWIADSEDVTGPASKLIHALGCSWLCRASIVRSVSQATAKTLKREKKPARLEKLEVRINVDGGLISNLGIINEKVKPSNRPPLLLRLPDDGWRIDGFNDEEHQLCRHVLKGATLEDAAKQDGRPIEELEAIADSIIKKSGCASFAQFCSQLAVFGVEDK